MADIFSCQLYRSGRLCIMFTVSSAIFPATSQEGVCAVPVTNHCVATRGKNPLGTLHAFNDTESIPMISNRSIALRFHLIQLFSIPNSTPVFFTYTSRPRSLSETSPFRSGRAFLRHF